MQFAERLRARACWRAGINIDAGIAMIAITTGNSIKVNFFASFYITPLESFCTVYNISLKIYQDNRFTSGKDVFFYQKSIIFYQ